MLPLLLLLMLLLLLLLPLLLWPSGMEGCREKRLGSWRV
jgi:hypothetical protein